MIRDVSIFDIRTLPEEKQIRKALGGEFYVFYHVSLSRIPHDSVRWKPLEQDPLPTSMPRIGTRRFMDFLVNLKLC